MSTEHRERWTLFRDKNGNLDASGPLIGETERVDVISFSAYKTLEQELRGVQFRFSSTYAHQLEKEIQTLEQKLKIAIENLAYYKNACDAGTKAREALAIINSNPTRKTRVLFLFRSYWRTFVSLFFNSNTH